MKFLLSIATVTLLVSSALLVKEPVKTKKISVEEALKKANITPCIFPEVPSKVLGVKYENAEVNLGNFIYAGDTIDLPTLDFKVDPKRPYTVMFLDPDIPSAEQPFLSLALQGLYVNVYNLDLESACVLAEYWAATPIPGTGLHRYIIALYEQECEIECCGNIDETDPNERIQFDLAGFVKKNKLCGPIAVNYYVSEFIDDLKSYCEELLC